MVPFPRRSLAGSGRLAATLGGVLAALVLQGCDLCSSGDLRCQGHVVQECSPSRNWETLHDCGADQCGVGRDACGDPLVPIPFGEVWCCRSP